MIAYVFFAFFSFVYSVLSYGFVAPSLVLSSNPQYWGFQEYAWQLVRTYQGLLPFIFGVVFIGLFLAYATLFYQLKKKNTKTSSFTKHPLRWYMLILGILFISYNAFSYDVFNYIFNGRMLIEYGANPHVQVALDFPDDPWTRFMHNTHTPAPYGYGWTALSTLPVFLGMGKFLPTLLFMRALMIGSVLFLYYSLSHFSKTMQGRELTATEFVLVFYNPLLLLEVVSNYHNDLWMMAPAVLALSLFVRGLKKQKQSAWSLVLAWALLTASISIKLVTVVLIPFAVLFTSVYFLQRRKNIFSILGMALQKYSGSLSTVLIVLVVCLLFIPLITIRSQQFLSWYLLWSFVFVPFVHIRAVRNTLIVFSATAVFRYLPLIGTAFAYTPEVHLQQRLILWVLPVLYCLSTLTRQSKNETTE